MNQKGRAFFYRGILLLVLAGIVVKSLSSTDQPWAYYVRTIGPGVLFVAIAAFTIIVSVGRFRQFRNAPLPEALPESLYVDRWHRIAGAAVVASVLLSVALAAVLLFVEPPRQCPQWHLPGYRSPSLWIPFFGLTLPLLAASAFMIIRWKWLIRKAIATVDYPTNMPVTYVLIITVLLDCAMSQFPWGLLVFKCGSAP